MKVCVVGGGIAGTAAAWSLARANVEVTVVFERAGASSLYSGALDMFEWNVTHVAWPLDSEIKAFAHALRIWQIGATETRIATSQGVVRTARGADEALLELEGLAGKRIAVADVGRDDWDASLLAKSLNASDFAVRTGTRFEPAALSILQSGHERRVGVYDFARLFDDEQRLALVLKELARSTVGFDAWLFGPWLGVERNAARELRERSGKQLGETTSPVGGAAGARFELARERLLRELRIAQRNARVTGLELGADGHRLRIEGEPDALLFDAVILAIGGVAAGGIELEPSFARRGGAGFRTSVAADLPIALNGEMLDGVPSVWGFDFTARGLSTLESVGIATSDGTKVRGIRDLYAAGDCVASQPRTALSAALSGILAARAVGSKC